MCMGVCIGVWCAFLCVHVYVGGCRCMCVHVGVGVVPNGSFSYNNSYRHIFQRDHIMTMGGRGYRTTTLLGVGVQGSTPRRVGTVY